MSEQMRKEFEAWYSDGGKWPQAVERSYGGNYTYMGADSAWTAWQAALATQSQAPQGAVTGWNLPLSAVNDLQEKSIDALIDKAKRARWVNAITRKDAVETTYEADWIKHMVKVAPPGIDGGNA